MILKDLISRVDEGEVVPVEHITGRFPDEVVAKHPELASRLTIENDEIAEIFWVYDKEIRSIREYNPIK